MADYIYTMELRLTPDQLKGVGLIQDVARAAGMNLYLTGGAIRDIISGFAIRDLDFTVQGNPLKLQKDFEKAGARVTAVEEDIRTIFLVLPGNARAEVSMARTERFEKTGRPPIVMPSTIHEDLRRRDFTVNAMARRLASGELVDPFGGEQDLGKRVLRTVRERSFAEDPLRLVRGLRFVSQLGLEPTDETRSQMQEEAASVRLVSGERIGGGLGADGLGELSKLLLASEPARALRLARDTGVLVALLPEFAPTIGLEQESARQHLSLDEHTFAVVQAAADANASLAVRLAALFHDLGKPGENGSHAQRSAAVAAEIMRRLRYPTRLTGHVKRLIAAHSFPLDHVDDLFARRFLREHGDELAFDLVAHKEADLRGKQVEPEELEAAARLRALLEQQQSQPHQLNDLAVDGSDLIELGYAEGPELGRALDALLDAVVDDPTLNTRKQLLERARVRLQ